MKRWIERDWICDQCGRPFERMRSCDRFCSPVCRYVFHVEERQKALAAWRAQRRTDRVEVTPVVEDAEPPPLIEGFRRRA
jgi:hypothetical protein